MQNEINRALVAKKARIFVLAAAMVCAVSMAANNKVSGVIKDAADKTALIGVNVSLKQGDQQVSGTVTDAHGKFSLEAETGEFVLECSYIGYEPIGMSLTVSGNIHLGTIEMNEASTELGEVVVEGDAVIQKVDRQILLPNKEQLGASSDGMSLLQSLQIPRIVVNPVENSVKTLANQEVQLRINGIEASNSEVMAINPKDVIRIEYHDQPGVRYNGAAAVINYIVKHRDTGGNLMLNASNGVTMPGWGEYHLSGKVNFGKSSFSLMTHYSPRDVYWTRTNAETYNLSMGTIENREVGEPTRFKMNPVNIGLTYNWTNGEKNRVQIALRDFMKFTPQSETNRDSYLYQGTDSFAIHDHESSKSISPSLDIYYEHNLPDDNHLYFDVVGTYINSSNDRRFQQIPLSPNSASASCVSPIGTYTRTCSFEQTPLGETVANTTDVTSRVRGNKYSLIGEAIYEKDWENIALTVGVRHNHQWMENRYASAINEKMVNDQMVNVSMTTAETYAFAEVQQRVKQFSYAVGIGAMHTYLEQAGQKQSNWIARPQLTLSYDFGKGVFWKYKGYVSGYQPSLSAMSDVAQQIDKFQIRQGNPDLKPVMFVANEMQLSWQSTPSAGSGTNVNLNLWANYSYDHKPIMDETFEQLIDGQSYAVRTYANHRGFHRLQVAPSVQVRLLQNKLIFTVAPFANYYVSLGNSYTHKHFNPGVRASIMGMYKGWQFFGEVTTRYNNLWGETLEYGEFYHHIGLGYNVDKWGFRAMLMNPFSVKGYSIETKDLSALAPNTQHAEMRDFRQMLILNFHCNLDFGSRASTRENKRINNEDKENGILSGTK